MTYSMIITNRTFLSCLFPGAWYTEEDLPNMTLTFQNKKSKTTFEVPSNELYQYEPLITCKIRSNNFEERNKKDYIVTHQIKMYGEMTLCLS